MGCTCIRDVFGVDPCKRGYDLLHGILGHEPVMGTWQSSDPRESLDAVQHMMREEGGEEWLAVQIYLQANNLRDMDFFSKSDPIVVVEVSDMSTDVPVWSELGCTEIVMNDLNPKWMKSFIVNYHFKLVQLLRFTVYDVDTTASLGCCFDVSNLKLQDQDFLGQTECWLPELLQANGKVLTKELMACSENTNLPPASCASEGVPRALPQHSGYRRGQAERRGTLTIHAEEVSSQSHGQVRLQFRGQGIRTDNLGSFSLFNFGYSNLYLRISRLLEDGSTSPIFQTEVVGGEVNPVWKTAVVSIQNLCSGDIERPLRIECFNRYIFTQDALIGSADRSVKDLQQDLELAKGVTLKRSSSWAPQGNRSVNLRMNGELFCSQCEIVTRKSFLQYLSMGGEISFHVAVDFTASNGHPSKPNSLHYIDPLGGQNVYQQAIRAVGRVLEFYDTDKLFPAWGFGGRVGSGMVSHCFNLNGDPYKSEVVGVDGILQAYLKACTFVSLAGPTLFAPVIARSSEMVEADLHKGKLKYSVLLILTDGVINDMESTINAIVVASRLPLSILIVGVGLADFSKMVELDSDGELLESHGVKAQRDMVQFVPMRNMSTSHHLACELLAELPEQMVEFMSSRPFKV